MKKLFRSRKNKVIGGVLGGIAEYFDMDPVLPRIIFLFAFFFVKPISGFLVIFYILSWIILPKKSTDLPENSEGSAREISNSVMSEKSQKFLAWALIGIGVVALLVIVIPVSFLHSINQYTWPSLLILLGFLILVASFPKKN